jgi:hypothetical protein
MKSEGFAFGHKFRIMGIAPRLIRMFSKVLLPQMDLLMQQRLVPAPRRGPSLPFGQRVVLRIKVISSSALRIAVNRVTGERLDVQAFE